MLIKSSGHKVSSNRSDTVTLVVDRGLSTLVVHRKEAQKALDTIKAALPQTLDNISAILLLQSFVEKR